MNCISVWVVPRAPVVKALYLSVRETGTFTRSGTHQAGWRGSDMGKWKEIGRQLLLPQLTNPHITTLSPTPPSLSLWTSHRLHRADLVRLGAQPGERVRDVRMLAAAWKCSASSGRTPARSPAALGAGGGRREPPPRRAMRVRRAQRATPRAAPGRSLPAARAACE